MSFSGQELGRAGRKSSAASQDGFAGSLSKPRTPKGSPDVKQKPGPSRLAMVASQRQRSLQKKALEPLRRAVADCLSASHHVTSAFTLEALRTLQVKSIFMLIMIVKIKSQRVVTQDPYSYTSPGAQLTAWKSIPQHSLEGMNEGKWSLLPNPVKPGSHYEKR